MGEQEDKIIGQEQSNSGYDTGLELEDAGNIEKPFDPEDIDVTTKPMTIDLLLSRIESGAINLQPDFQRRWGIWDDKRQSRLVESLLLRIPVPSLYAAEDQDENWEIVDGVQRLYTIARFIKHKAIDETSLSLSGLSTLTQLNGQKFADLPQKLQRRLRETEFVIHVIRKGTPTAVKYSIFERINTGSVVLSAQELRHAITPGASRQILEELAGSEEFKKATNHSIRSNRMDDRELVLRFIAFRLTSYREYRTDIDGFLLEAMESLNRLDPLRTVQIKDDFKNAMIAAYDIFGLHAFRKRYDPYANRLPINKALFESISISLAEKSNEEINALIACRDAVMEELIKLCHNRAFESSISQGTGNVARVRLRFEMIAQLFRGVLGNA